jgi:hypothetical protein
MVAHAIRSVHCGCVEQHDGRDRQYLEEGIHEREVKVYSYSGCLQQIHPATRAGGETGVQDVG